MNRSRSTVTIVVLVGATGVAAFAAGLLAGSANSAAGRTASFGWLRPAAPPSSWRVSRLPDSPASLAYPEGWRPARSDPGTRTAVLRSRSGAIVGYLNATPQSGEETLSNWASFRPAHNAEEGERRIGVIAAAEGLRFRSGTGSCVADAYTTSSARRYREIACIVAGRRATTVVVGAAAPFHWEGLKPAIERAISSFST
jgi:hypothetical protein